MAADAARQRVLRPARRGLADPPRAEVGPCRIPAALHFTGRGAAAWRSGLRGTLSHVGWAIVRARFQPRPLGNTVVTGFRRRCSPLP